MPAAAVAADPVATATTITVSPSSGTSSTDFKLTAKVLPIPDSGNVRITAWSAQTGGYITWDHSFAVNDNGVATVSYVQIDAGTSWWQAEYLGSTGYAASASGRTSVNVTGNPISMTNAQVSWSDSSINFSALVQQASFQHGSLELVVDGEVYASCVPYGQSIGCSVSNKTTRGTHEVFIRYVPANRTYANGISQTWIVSTGEPLPPSSGVVINGDAFATPTLAVDLNIGTNSSNVDFVKVSNTAEGLDAASPIPYAQVTPWQVDAGADGYRTVYTKLHVSGSADWSSEVYSDSIFLDTTAPTGSFVINDDDPTLGDAWGDAGGIDSDQYLSGSVTDNSVGEPGGGITNYAVSTDCRRFIYGVLNSSPDDFQATVSIFGESWGDGVSNEGGVKTFCVRWRDAAGNWSEPATDSIKFMWNLSVGHLLANGLLVQGAPNAPQYVSSTTVDLKIVLDELPDEGIQSIKVYGNNGSPDENSGPNLGMAWPNGATSITIPWSLTNETYGYTSKDGIRNVAVRFLTKNGRVQWFGGMVLLDRASPTSDTPVPAVAMDTTINQQAGADGFGPTALATITTVATNIQWKATDTASGIKGYDLDRLVYGSWTDVALAKPTDTSVRQTVASGTSNQFRVQATDKAGNTSAWKNGPAFAATLVDSTATNLVYGGTWKTDIRADAIGGSIRTVKTLGASVKLTFTGRGIALIAPRGISTLTAPANVFIDGKLIKAAFVTASTYQPRRVVFTTSWKAKGTHTIKIVKKYASNTLPFDAFVILN